MSTTVRQLQVALKGQGFDPGPLDGVLGRATMAALQSFIEGKLRHETPAIQPVSRTPVVTLAKLGLDPAAAANVARDLRVPWFVEAMRLTGTLETPGARSNPVIMGWAEKLGGWVKSYYANDGVPWCGLFVAHCIGATLPAEPLPTNPLSARAWRSFGRAIGKPAQGAIVVFGRKGGGHVGFYEGEDRDAYLVRGGNQSDKVCVARVARSRLLPGGIRWPSTAPLPTGAPLVIEARGPLSHDEA